MKILFLPIFPGNIWGPKHYQTKQEALDQPGAVGVVTVRIKDG
jgi:hypothetical protein